MLAKATGGPFNVRQENTDMKTSLKTVSILALTFAVLIAFNLWDHEWKFLKIWAYHVVPTALLGAPIWYFARHRVDWGSSDFLIVTVPFLVYLAAILVQAALAIPERGGMGNLVDPVFLGCFLPLSPLTRAIVGKRGGARLSVGLLLALCVLSVAIYAFMPASE